MRQPATILSLLPSFLLIQCENILEVNAFSLPPVAHGVVSAISPQLGSKEKHARHTSLLILVASSSTTVEMERNEEYLKNKDALKQDLRKEYESFFEIFATERYLPDVQFIDPLTSFTGLENYRSNVDMLGGRSLLGKILFKDASITLHYIEEPGPFRLRTRWTLSMRFNAVPWKPLGEFTGVSEYTLDSKARVVKQVDFWDSINLVEGQYKAVSPLSGVKDFVGQILPGRRATSTRGHGEAGGELLRRAKEYEVRLFQRAGGVIREGGAASSSPPPSPEVIASRDFDGDATAEAVALNSRALLESLRRDGLQPEDTLPVLNTPGAIKAHQEKSFCWIVDGGGVVDSPILARNYKVKSMGLDGKTLCT